jgi:hypothetical protein
MSTFVFNNPGTYNIVIDVNTQANNAIKTTQNVTDYEKCAYKTPQNATDYEKYASKTPQNVTEYEKYVVSKTSQNDNDFENKMKTIETQYANNNAKCKKQNKIKSSKNNPLPLRDQKVIAKVAKFYSIPYDDAPDAHEMSDSDSSNKSTNTKSDPDYKLSDNSSYSSSSTSAKKTRKTVSKKIKKNNKRNATNAPNAPKTITDFQEFKNNQATIKDKTIFFATILWDYTGEELINFMRKNNLITNDLHPVMTIYNYPIITDADYLTYAKNSETNIASFKNTKCIKILETTNHIKEYYGIIHKYNSFKYNIAQESHRNSFIIAIKNAMNAYDKTNKYKTIYDYIAKYHDKLNIVDYVIDDYIVRLFIESKYPINAIFNELNLYIFHRMCEKSSSCVKQNKIVYRHLKNLSNKQYHIIPTIPPVPSNYISVFRTMPTLSFILPPEFIQKYPIYYENEKTKYEDLFPFMTTEQMNIVISTFACANYGYISISKFIHTNLMKNITDPDKINYYNKNEKKPLLNTNETYIKNSIEFAKYYIRVKKFDNNSKFMNETVKINNAIDNYYKNKIQNKVFNQYKNDKIFNIVNSWLFENFAMIAINLDFCSMFWQTAMFVYNKRKLNNKILIEKTNEFIKTSYADANFKHIYGLQLFLYKSNAINLDKPCNLSNSNANTSVINTQQCDLAGSNANTSVINTQPRDLSGSNTHAINTHPCDLSGSNFDAPVIIAQPCDLSDSENDSPVIPAQSSGPTINTQNPKHCNKFVGQKFIIITKNEKCTMQEKTEIQSDYFKFIEEQTKILKTQNPDLSQIDIIEQIQNLWCKKNNAASDANEAASNASTDSDD